MKRTTSLVLAIAAAALVVTTSGCSTFNSRAREKSSTYANLSDSTRERLREGLINVGDTPDMVYIALGEPDVKRQHTSARDDRETWVYKTYWEQYEGTEWLGWHRYVIRDRRHHRYTIIREPITRDVYSQRSEDVIRVTFVDGRVSDIDQQSPA